MPTPIERCISCGALSETGPRCRACVWPDGTPKSREAILDALAQHLVRSLDLTEKAAREVADARLARLPAWTDSARKKEQD